MSVNSSPVTGSLYAFQWLYLVYQIHHAQSDRRVEYMHVRTEVTQETMPVVFCWTESVLIGFVSKCIILFWLILFLFCFMTRKTKVDFSLVTSLSLPQAINLLTHPSGALCLTTFLFLYFVLLYIFQMVSKVSWRNSQENSKNFRIYQFYSL